MPKRKIRISAKEEINNYICPISRMIMKRPVLAADGYMYEKMHMRHWLSKKDTSPMTNKIINNKLIHMVSIEKHINEILEKSPELKTNQFNYSYGENKDHIMMNILSDNLDDLLDYSDFVLSDVYEDKMFMERLKKKTPTEKVVIHVIDNCIDLYTIIDYLFLNCNDNVRLHLVQKIPILDFMCCVTNNSEKICSDKTINVCIDRMIECNLIEKNDMLQKFFLTVCENNSCSTIIKLLDYLQSKFGDIHDMINKKMFNEIMKEEYEIIKCIIKICDKNMNEYIDDFSCIINLVENNKISTDKQLEIIGYIMKNIKL